MGRNSKRERIRLAKIIGLLISARSNKSYYTVEFVSRRIKLVITSSAVTINLQITVS